MAEILVYSDENSVTINPNYNILPTHKEIDNIISVFQQLKKDFTPSEIDQHNKKALKDNRPNRVDKHTAKKTKAVEGYVYVVRSEKLYKIGRSCYPCQWIDQYRTENPYDIDIILLAKVPDYVAFEGKLLERLSEKQHHGEWFTLDKSDFQIIKNFILQNAGMLVDLPEKV